MNRHPLENPSLAPFGLAFPISVQRLDYEANNLFWVNSEKIIAREWDRSNRLRAPRPLPVATIIHTILPGLATRSRMVKGDFEFEGQPYLTRDIMLLSSVMQWFGSNVGSCFLESPMGKLPHHFHPAREFILKLEKEEELLRNPMYGGKDLVAMWVHKCTSECRNKFRIPTGCFYDRRLVTERDRDVVNGLMHWLGRRAGREFIAHLQARLKRANKAASERAFQSMRESRLIAHATKSS